MNLNFFFMRKLFRRKFFFVIVSILLILIGLAYYFFKVNSIKQPTATKVVVEAISMQNIPLAINSLGNVVALESTMLSAQQAGVVSKIYFKNGQVVKRGALLIQLNDSVQRAIYNRDNAALANAKSLYERYQQLNDVDPSVLSKVQMNQVYTDYQEAIAILQEDQQTLDEMQIRAPFAGVLGASNVSVGTYLNVGEEIIAIVNPNSLEVVYPVAEAEFGMVQLGQKVTLASDAYPNVSFSGTVIYKSPLVDPDNRAFTVRAKIDNPEGLIPGMLMHVTQILIAERMVLAVPTAALISDMSGFGVYQIKDGRVVETFIQIGFQFGDYTEVINGLSVGESVITGGNSKVQPGMAVQAVSGT